MKKLQLQIEDLEVESFRTLARPAGPGTVRGFNSDDTFCWYCDPDTGYRDCPLSETCEHSICCAPTPNTHCVE